MATLTEKQKIVKEILGSKESIRKFVQDEGIHTEDLENYSALILAVVLEEKEAKKNQVKADAQRAQEKLIEGMTLAGLTIQEINEALGIADSSEYQKGKSRTESTSKVTRAAAKKYRFFTMGSHEDEKIIEIRSCQGHPSKSLIPYMLDMGYVDAQGKASLKVWVERENLQPIEV